MFMKNKNNKKTNLLTRILHDKKGIYVTTAMKIVIALVLGITILTGTTYVVKDVVMPQTEQKIVDAFDKDYSKGTSGQLGPASTGNQGELSIESLKENHEFSYYSSLSKAVEDVNSDSLTNQDADEATALAGAYKDGELYSIVLLKDSTLSEKLTINRSTIFNLGGKTLELTTGDAAIGFTNGVNTIDGRLSGSSVTKSPTSKVTSNTPVCMFQADGAAFAISGGNYGFTGSYNANITAVSTPSSGTADVSISNCTFNADVVNDTATNIFKIIDTKVVTINNSNVSVSANCKTWCIFANSKLSINNSVFNVSGRNANTVFVAKSTESCDAKLSNNYMHVELVDGAGSGASVRAFATLGSSTATVSNCEISTSSNNAGSVALATMSATSSLKIENSEISSDSTSGMAYTIYNNEASCEIINDKILCDSTSGTSLAVGNYNGTCEITNTDIFCDNANDDHGGAVANSGTLTFNSGVVTGVHSGLQTTSGSKTYINGGVFQSCHHGGIYFSHGPTGEAYVRNATIKNIEYNGKHDPSQFPDGNRYAAMYVGGGSGANYKNMSTYLDNCKIEIDSGCDWLLFMRGSSGETGNKLYISNSTVSTNKKIRTDRDNKVIVGAGTNITSSMAHTPANILFTDETYAKN